MNLRLIIFTCSLAVVTTQPAATCPSECLCYLDPRGRSTVECKRGGMVGPLLFTNMSADLEVLKITAPEDNMNEISMNPNIQNYRHLEEVHITRSNIPNLGEHFFYGLSKLEVLNLSQNNITQPLPGNFRFLVKLKELYLDENRIYSLASETFRYLTDLKVLSLQKNRIEKLISGVFRGLTKLTTLKLNGNIISDFNPESFKEVKELRVLECRGCSLISINPYVHERLPLLTHLDLGQNELQSIKPEDFANLKRLKVLKLDYNRLTRIPDLVFTKSGDLRKISFARNEIVEIGKNAFTNLENLTELDLSYNHLKHLDGRTLRPVSESLEKLVLSGNNVPLFVVKELLSMTELKDLQLADSGIVDVDDSFAPDSVAILNIAGNKLSYLPAFVLPGGLKELDISRNMFRGLDGEVVDRLERVRCKFDNNPWSCDLCHIIPMLDRVNKSLAIFNVRCALPYHHANKILGNVRRDQLSWCNAAGYPSEGANFFLRNDDGRLGLIAAGASLMLLMLTAVAALGAYCYTRRHAANYYTHEEKRLDEHEAIYETQSPLFGEELSFKFPLESSEKKISIATIDEIKKEHAVSNGT